MNQDFNSEALSALMDGELSSFELRRLLGTLESTSLTDGKASSGSQQAVYARWMRWHVAQDALHGQAGTCQADMDFCARVSQAIAAEPAPARRVWRGSAARITVAASVALAVVAGWQAWQGNEEGKALPVMAKNQINQNATYVSYPVTSAPSYGAGFANAEVRPVVETFTISGDSALAQMLESASVQHMQPQLTEKQPLIVHQRRSVSP